MKPDEDLVTPPAEAWHTAATAMTDLPRRLLLLSALIALGVSPLFGVSIGVSFDVTRSADEDTGERYADEREASDDTRARTSLETLSGCYAVRYQFIEDGTGDFFFDDGVEYIDVEARGRGYFVRNFLVYEGETFLHWTQEWVPTEAGRWLLTVRSGDGSLRYRSDGVWRFNQWEGGAALAGKPIRDGLRTDYDHLIRRNILQFTDEHWAHSEVNMKMSADNTPVASEVGWITYTRRESNELCAPLGQ